tara:strand:- start:375 stop:1073 length:699 start_codon:yes stop_codon:yes gene_type:complete
MNKKIIVTTISILLIIFFFIKFNKDIVSDYILTKISKWTERTVTSKSVEIDYSLGKINFNGLEILNKPNFNDKNIFEAKELTIEIEFSSLFSDLVKINKFILNEPKFFFEIKDMTKKQEKKETTKDNIGLVEKIIEQPPPKIYPPKKKDKNFIILNSSITNSKVFIRHPNSSETLTFNLSNMSFQNTGNADLKQIKHSHHYKDVLKIILGDIYFRIPDMKLRKFLKEKYKIK